MGTKKEKTEQTAVDVTKIIRCDIDMKSGKQSQGVKVNSNGDVTFEAVAVDKAKTANRKGFTFGWNSPEDVDVQPLKENGRLYWMHESMYFPVGYITEVSVNTQRVRFKGLIPGDSRFPEDMQDGEYMAFLRDLRGAVQSGLVKAVSIGFYVKQYEETTDSDGKPAIMVTQLEIVEISIVTIGAHPSALIQQAEAVHNDENASAHFTKSLLKPAKWESQDGDKERLIRMSLQAPAGAIVPVDDTPALNPCETKEDAMTLMAKALGARGANPDRTVYEFAAKEYSRFKMKTKIPAYDDDYLPDELKALHDAGQIIIPGAKGNTEAIDKAIQEIRQSIEQLTATVARVAERVESGKQDQSPAAYGPPEPELLPDLDALRTRIAEALADSPSVQANVKRTADQLFARMRKG